MRGRMRRVMAVRGRTIGVVAMVITLMAMVAPSSLAAQERRGPRRMGGFGGGPTWWFSASAGWQWSGQVGDPKTNSVWDFDSNWSTRFTAEREVAPRTTVGLLFNYARLPLRIASASTSACGIACAADATLATYGLMARSGGGPGFHMAYEGFIGATRYSNFTLKPNASSVPASEFNGLTNTDFAWAFSTGFGYGISRDFEMTAMFDYGTSVHEKSPDLFQRRTTRHYGTRVGLRVGL